ncbi:MAG TPA: YbiU family protein [Dongiaceae bacterium]|nr:YbiU family protein [Dongiaceae bacterium]
MTQPKTADTLDVTDRIVDFKRSLAPRRAMLKRAFDEVAGEIAREVEAIRSAGAAGRPVIPEIGYDAIRDGRVPREAGAAVRRTGCAIVRGVFPPAVAGAWFDEVGEYLETNNYEERWAERGNLDRYFAEVKSKSGRQQMFNVYWSKPQVMARQDRKLAETRAFLDRLWSGYEGVFNPDLQLSYADRVRRREPGDTTLEIAPHMDAGTVERWIDPGYQRVYEPVFAGDWRRYDPFDARHRLETYEFPSPAVASVFRTYQGWTALTRQGPNDGSLELVPIARGVIYMLLRAVQDDVAEDDLCGAKVGRALRITGDWHPLLIAGKVPIPEVAPGDAVFWHSDICHAVGPINAGPDYASVIYIGACPDCSKNRAYIERQRPAFLEGRSPPDFAAMDFEVDFKGRATIDDLTPLGRAQMGF